MPAEAYWSNHSAAARPADRGLARQTVALGLLWIGFLATGVVSFFHLLEPGIPVSPPAMDVAVRVEPPRRIVVVVLDALRSDVALDPTVMPELARLRDRGTFGRHRTGRFPVSASFYKAFLAGKPAGIWDVYNDLSPRPRSLDSWVTRAGLSCYFSGPASGYAWLAGHARADYVWHLDSMDRISDYDARVRDAALKRLQDMGRGILFCHLASLDAAAHRRGGTSSEYRQVARRLDDAVGRLANLLDLGRDVLLVLSDHGVRDDGGHSSDSDPTVALAPFVACGPMFESKRGVEFDQTAWPMLMAAITGCPVPPGYVGMPPRPVLRGAAAERLRLLNQKYARLLLERVSPRSLAAAVRPVQDALGRRPARSAASLVKAAKDGAASVARLIWGLCTLTAAGLATLTLKQCAPYRSANSGLLVILLVGGSLGWLTLEHFSATGGQLDGTCLDSLPELRAHEFFRAPLAVLGAAGLVATVVALLRRADLRAVAVVCVALCTSVLALQRNRADLLLYAALALGGMSVWAWRTHPGGRRPALALCALFPLAAMGQKLAYDQAHHGGFPWSAAVSALGLVAFTWCVARRRDHFLLAFAGVSALGVTARAAREPRLAVAAWVLLGILAVLSLRDRFRRKHSLAGLAVVLAPLVLPWPQTWPVFALACLVTSGPHPAADTRAEAGRGSEVSRWFVASGVALLTCLLLFFYGSGRDAYLPINEFYRTSIGAEVSGLEFSMARAALAVAARFVLYVCGGVALARWVVAGVGASEVLCGVLAFFGLRLTANAIAFALYAERAWNYHLSLLFNDAMFVAATAVIGLWVAGFGRVEPAQASRQ